MARFADADVKALSILALARMQSGGGGLVQGWE